MLAGTLTMLGLLDKNTMGYHLTLESEQFLVKSPPTYVGGTVASMLATTPAGDAYTFKELNAMFMNAGFGQSAMYDVPDSNEHVIVTSKH